MNYSYTINKVLPKSEFMSVTYSADGYPDYRRNFNPTDFTEAALVGLIEAFAPRVVEFWERQANHPDTIAPLSGSASAEAPVVKPVDFSHTPAIEPQPAFDMFTQYVTLNKIEDPMQATVGWTIHDMTAEEVAAFLSNWRASFSVTMRQARLALAQSGKLQDVEAAIAAMPEPDKSAVSIEWEYGSTVERGSAWVGAMGPALSMTDEQLDDLFKLAATL